jgi:AcrR family transcriptional regulator
MTAVEQQPPRRTRMPAAERRESVLAAATEVFAASGYHAAKMSDIAARVGVSEPVVFQNFGSKPALFAAVLERTAARAQASLTDATAHFGSAGALLARILGDPGGHAPPGGGEAPGGQHRSHAGQLFAAAVALAADPALPEQRGPLLRVLVGHLADLVARGQQDGSVRADIDPGPAGWLLVSVLTARRVRADAMPAGGEQAVAELAARLLRPEPGRR